MSRFWNKESEKPTRHRDPDEAVARYLDQLHQADVAGASPPASALNGLGDAYLDKGDLASAVDYYRQAAEEYAREGMHTNAIACLKKVRRHAADEGDAGLLLGRYYAAKKLVPDALAELEAFAERRQRIGNRKQAIEAMKEVVRLVPDDAPRRERLADLLREEGQTDAAVGAYREARTRYRDQGAEAGVQRVAGRIEELGGVVEPAAETGPGPAAEPPPEAADAGGRAEGPTPPAAAPVVPEELEAPAEDRSEPEPKPLPEEEPAGEEPAGGPLAMGLEIERTSYRDEPGVAAREEEPGEPAEPEEPGPLEIVFDVPEDLAPEDEEDDDDRLTIAQQNVGTEEPVERLEIERSSVRADGEAAEAGEPTGGEPEAGLDEDAESRRIDLPDAPADLAGAAAELERAADDLDRPGADAPPPDASEAEPEAPPAGGAGDQGVEPGAPPKGDTIVPEPRSHEEMMALAEQHVRTGDVEQAGRYLLLAAEGLREEGRWRDAAHAYGRLAGIGQAKDEDFEDWVECARQTGRANAVLEALETASRWNLERGNPAAARRSAEEMFLVDPDSQVAADLLDRIAGPSRG